MYVMHECGKNTKYVRVLPIFTMISKAPLQLHMSFYPPSLAASCLYPHPTPPPLTCMLPTKKSFLITTLIELATNLR